ncbi:MAG: YjjG family noncanonical pyrimidine nucleotidase [Bacteroidota bacterium]
MKTYHWLFFDLDNTLLDFDQSEANALRNSLLAHGIEPTEDVLASYHHINRACWTAFEKGQLRQDLLNDLRFERFVADIGSPVDHSTLSRYYLQQLVECRFPVLGAFELLRRLQGKYRLGVVTNGLKAVQRPRLHKNDMVSYFDSITVSEEIGVSKPHAAFFDHAFQVSGQPHRSEVLMIGDSLSSDIQGGADYGLDTCWFNPKGKARSGAVVPTFEIRGLGELWGVLNGER